MAEELNKFETFKTIADYESNLKSAQKVKDDLDADIKTLNDALDTNITSFTFKGKKYSLSALNDLIVTLEGKKELVQVDVEVANSNLNTVKKDNKNALSKLEQGLDAAKKQRDLAIFQFKKGVIDETTRNAAFTKVTDIETDKKRIQVGGELAFAASAAPGSVATYGFRSDVGVSEKVGVSSGEQLAQRAGVGAQTISTEPVVAAETDVTGTTVIPVVDVNKRKAFVNAQLISRGLKDTPANRDILRKEYVASLTPTKTVVDGKTVDGKTVVAPVSTAWEAIIRDKFPEKSWLLDLDRTKYPQLFKVLATAIAEESYKTPEGRARFETQVAGTDFFKEISQSKQLKTIQSLVGTLGFEGSDYIKFVSDSINMGYSGDILKQKVYAEAFKKVDGNYVNPTAFKRVKESADYISTQNIAKAYFNRNPLDSDIENVLTGTMLSADYERQQRVFAGDRYGHLKNLLDQGMTMESIASAYQTTASKLLERNVNDIDMSTGAFEQAVTFGEEGKKRLMTNSEWEKLLRSDPQYGWEKTNNAKDEARSLSANIAQAFGRIL